MNGYRGEAVAEEGETSIKGGRRSEVHEAPSFNSGASVSFSSDGTLHYFGFRRRL